MTTGALQNVQQATHKTTAVSLYVLTDFSPVLLFAGSQVAQVVQILQHGVVCSVSYHSLNSVEEMQGYRDKRELLGL